MPSRRILTLEPRPALGAPLRIGMDDAWAAMILGEAALAARLGKLEAVAFSGERRAEVEGKVLE